MTARRSALSIQCALSIGLVLPDRMVTMCNVPNLFLTSLSGITLDFVL